MPLKPAASAAARRTIKDAFDQLEQTILPEDSHDFSTTTLDHVRKSALAIEDQLAARKSLRNMRRLVPLFNGLEHYGRVVEILCNGTPYLSWVWAPISLVLRIASEYIEAFEKIIKGYSRIAESLGRFRVLSEALIGKPDFQQTLAVFYADILQFHKHAYSFVRRKSWRLMFLTSWGRFERRFENILDDMKRHEELVDLQAGAHGIMEIRQTREDIKSWREESLAQVQKWNDKQANKQYESIMTWLKSEESDQLAILDTISAEGAKFAGTCSWALKNGRIKSWLQKTPESPVLWLQGTPGSGKSVLASQIVRFMRSANMFLVHHFCTHRYASSTTYEQILRSILLQLLRKDDELIAHVYGDCVLGKKPPTVQALERLIYALFNIASRQPRETEYIWIIIDGLNECEPRRQASVVSLINQITRKTIGIGDTICKVLISSRNSSHIANRLGTQHVMSLTEEKSSVKLAIRQYVSQRLRSMHEKLRQLELSRKDIDSIESVITNKADGMFLYARLVLDYLSKNIFFSGKEMKASIDDLPEELSEFYRKILLQILVQLDPRSADRIRCIFGWIAFAKRPLKRMEFLSALTFSPGSPNVTNLVPRYVLDICGALVEERPDTTLTFIHISVKEFLQSSSSNLVIEETEAMTEHCLSTLACLMCGTDVFLGSEPQHIRAQRVVKGIHGFHVYATEFWTEYLLHHVSTCSSGGSSSIFKLASELAQKLQNLQGATVTQHLSPKTYPMDDRLKFLEDQPLLQELVEASLGSRSLKRLETNLFYEIRQARNCGEEMTDSTNRVTDPQLGTSLGVQDGITLMLSSYQEIVRLLLKQDQYPGISGEDLDLFKSQFSSTAFTCRLSFCPRATTGFTSEELRRQHEVAHTQLSICDVPECTYPPFFSIRALKSHINKHHRPEPARRPIRRAGPSRPSIPLTDSGAESASRGSLAPEGLLESSHKDTSWDSDIFSLDNHKRRLEADFSGDKPGFGRPDRPSHDWDPEISKTDSYRRDSIVSESNKSDGIEQVKLDSIGFRVCSMPSCGMKLSPTSEVEQYGRHCPEFMEYHYWNWHHAESMARCALKNCDMIFSSNKGLQAHYEQRHTTLLCNNCEEFPDGFTLEDELRHHWRYHHHFRLSKRWMCDNLGQLGGPSEILSLRGNCESCAAKHKFDRKEDAITHLLSNHLYANDSRVFLSRIAEKCVRHVWVYEAEERAGTKFKGRPEDTDCEESDGEDQSGLDDMFYVRELA